MIALRLLGGALFSCRSFRTKEKCTKQDSASVSIRIDYMYYCSYKKILQCKATLSEYYTKDYISNGIRSRLDVNRTARKEH